MRIIILALLMLSSSIAYAYVGPGLGLGAIGALFGGIVALLLAIVGVVWYPIKRVLKKRKQTSDSAKEESANGQGRAEEQGIKKNGGK